RKSTVRASSHNPNPARAKTRAATIARTALSRTSAKPGKWEPNPDGVPQFVATSAVDSSSEVPGASGPFWPGAVAPGAPSSSGSAMPPGANVTVIGTVGELKLPAASRWIARTSAGPGGIGARHTHPSAVTGTEHT